MNNLNSILLEGSLKGGTDLRPDGVCAFVVESRRSYMKGETREVDVCFFNIETSGRLAEVCAEYLKDGRGVRVVGRIVQILRPDESDYPRSYVYIHAEHVEFKPEPKKAAAEHAEAAAL